jgi:hypothetical protein
MRRDVLNKQAELDQRLKDLVEALASATASVREILAQVHTAVSEAASELDQIDMFPPSREVLRPTCFDCGRRDLEVFHTSRRLGYHLCPDCFVERERRGIAKVAGPGTS